MKWIRIWLSSFALLTGMFAYTVRAADLVVPANSIEALAVSKSGGSTVLKLDLRQALSAPPSHFSIVSPARLVFDFPDTGNGLGYTSKAVNDGGVRSVNVIQAGERSRLVLNLEKSMRFETRQDGRTLLITLLGTGDVAKASGQFQAGSMAEAHAIRDIQFRRDRDGAGRIVVDLTSSDTGIDIQQKGTKLQVVFNKTVLPENLRRQLDVVDFATPVTTINTTVTGADTVMDIVPKGLWEHVAFQSDNQFIIEVKPVKEDPNKLFQGTKTGYQGELISLDFHSVPVYELLRVFADITNFNIIASDSVAALGKVTLRMRDVPWDQALDMVLEMKNLAKRKNGSVIWIAPRDEMLAMEKQELESRQQISQLEPTHTESFQINYQKAEDVQRLLGNKDQPVLSKTGSVVVDSYSNRLFVTDVPSKLNKVRELINLIDQPAKQVLIEARVVEARDNFGRELGVRMSLLNNKQTKVASDNAGDVFVSGGAAALSGTSSSGTLASTSFTQATTMGQLSFSLFNAGFTRILNLELSAMEADGKGKSLSNPRVVTGNNIKALIEQGDEIPVVSLNAQGTPKIEYKKAKLSLETTPQITPDGRIKMRLVISKDRPDFGRKVMENPTIITAKVETEVMVDNGGTLVIGGVTSEDSVVAEDRIPVLGDLPYVGFLFKHKNTSQERKELLVFITPKIVDDNLTLK
jgi:type IV pilus assembly protein PilQ